MKKFKSIFLTAALSLVFFACEQEVAELNPYPSAGGGSSSGTSGSADFSKFVTIGGAYTAGFGDGGLLHSGLQTIFCWKNDCCSTCSRRWIFNIRTT